MQLSLKQVTFSLTPGHAALTTVDRRSSQMVRDLAHSKGQRRGAGDRNAADVSWRRRTEERRDGEDGLAGDGNRESLESSFMWTRLEGGPRTHDWRRASGTYGAPCLLDDCAGATEEKRDSISCSPPIPRYADLTMPSSPGPASVAK